MRLNSGEFETKVEDGAFDISITQESDCSSDGGYTFENVTNIYDLDKEEALALIEELQYFVNSN